MKNIGEKLQDLAAELRKNCEETRPKRPQFKLYTDEELYAIYGRHSETNKLNGQK